jgi:hypothetical protein
MKVNMKRMLKNILIIILIIFLFLNIVYFLYTYIENFDNNYINNVALIIPAHPPHYLFIYDLLKKTNKKIDVYIVFSNQDDFDKFEQKDYINNIIIPSINTNSIVTYKKFYALKQLKDNLKYDYLITIDSETDIINENFTKDNLLNKIETIFKNKTIYAFDISENELYQDILYKSANIFKNPDDVNKLKNITNNYSLYYWWTNLPIYKRNNLNDFFNKINNDLSSWHEFDHIIYSNYLLLYESFNILNTTKIINVGDFIHNTENINNIEKLKDFNYGYSFMYYGVFQHHKEFLTNEATIFLFNIDRR